MPTQTFFNLPEEKKERITQAAVSEFATNLFEKSSVARIVKNAGIPRGSFYQYFSDLKDLYNYIFTIVGEEKLNYIREKVPQINGEDFDFFRILKALYTAGIQFAEENPELTAIGNNYFKETESFRHEIMGVHQSKAEQFYADLIQRGLAHGQLDPSINFSLTTFLMTSLNISLIDYYVSRLKSDDFLAQKDDLLHLVDDLLELISNGIKMRT